MYDREWPTKPVRLYSRTKTRLLTVTSSFCERRFNEGEKQVSERALGSLPPSLPVRPASGPEASRPLVLSVQSLWRTVRELGRPGGHRILTKG